MLASQYRAASRGKPQSPFVLFYQLNDTTEIAVDEKTYGNDSRFCRRSANYNADLKHIIDKGSLHIFIVAIKSIEKNQVHVHLNCVCIVHIFICIIFQNEAKS
jgi:hypothetical protein